MEAARRHLGFSLRLSETTTRALSQSGKFLFSFSLGNVFVSFLPYELGLHSSADISKDFVWK